MITNNSIKIEIDNIDKDILELTDVKGSDFIRIDTIVRCQGDNNSCTIFLNNGNKHIVYKNLKDIGLLLPASKFIKIHQSNIVNIAFVNNYLQAEATLIMHDGIRLPISRSKKGLLTSLIKKA